MGRGSVGDRLARLLMSIGALFALVFILRAVAASRTGGGKTFGQRKRSPEFLNILVRTLGWVFITPLIAVVTGALPAVGVMLWALWLPVAFPAATLSLALIPLGLVRTAYWFASLSPPLAHAREARGGAVLVAVRALGSKRTVDASMIDWLESRVPQRSSARGLAIAAAGLLRAARRDFDGARSLLGAVSGISPRASTKARGIARSWLVADAASRGDWTEVAALGTSGAKPGALRWPYAMGLIAERLTHHPMGASNARLIFAWAKAPHRRATVRLLRRAMATAPANPLETVAVDLPTDGAALLDTALGAHATCLIRPTASSVAHAGRAWDAVRSSSAVAALLARRALALGAQLSEGRALAAVLASAEADLTQVIPAANLKDAELGSSPTLEAASGSMRRRRMDDIGALSRAFARRTAEKRELASASEWMEWGSLCTRCDRALRSAPPTTRRTVFEIVYSPVCDYAAWLHNGRDEKLLANAIFRWLAEQSRGSGNATAIALLEKNATLGEP